MEKPKTHLGKLCPSLICESGYAKCVSMLEVQLCAVSSQWMVHSAASSALGVIRTEN